MVLKPNDQVKNGSITYTIERQLGVGRFGETYQARDLQGNRLVLNSLNESMLATLPQAEQDRLKSQFLQEASKLEACNNRHVVTAGRPFSYAGRDYLPLEYIDGPSLADVVNATTPDRPNPWLEEAVALRYIRQIGRALMVVHDKKLIHRDVKPENIRLRVGGKENEAVLTDFGLALDVNVNYTQPRTQEASDGYAPPELYSRIKGPIGEHTDVYSLAATLYRLLTGQQPKGALLRTDEIKAGRPDPLEPPRRFNPSVSASVEAAILKGMQLDPTKRPKSVQAWLKELGITETLPNASRPAFFGFGNLFQDWGDLPTDKKVDIIVKLVGIPLAIIGATAALLTAISNYNKANQPVAPSPSPASPTSPSPVASPSPTTSP